MSPQIPAIIFLSPKHGYPSCVGCNIQNVKVEMKVADFFKEFATYKVTRLYRRHMEVVTHIGLIHFLSPIRSLSIFFLSLSKCSPHCFPISHWDKPFCGRHQGVPFSWRSLVGPFSWRCCDVSFSQGIQHASFSLMHQAELSPWRPFDGTRYSGP